ncbi:MAG: hypothetical protein HN742_29510 [Lentisphaerae bacterium]|jgi:hypothetical protein|nr:hypothetical protein [Lentisphaerota bacterium]MBT4814693.1 hypothetical protein [Lentisphaerota bacterium]MBT5609035.1 hypothetical protein [Lentisphaerota bacterium]MBT7055467.1 hypothetical protein [Lentisphaerota bacterium]MBT7846046.1 hypothetical protein [Lentisphaerota bacterium]
MSRAPNQGMSTTALGRMVLLVCGLCLVRIYAADVITPVLPASGKTWVEIDGTVYGAKPDKRGPIGGGNGYHEILQTGDYRVSNVDQFIEALGKAKAGDVVYLEPDANVDCTTLIFAEKLVLKIPGGVTIASNRGHEGSLGGIIYCDAFAARPLMRTLGPNVRLTGLRLRGPDAKRRVDHHRRSFKPARGDRKGQHEYYYKVPVSEGIRAEFPGLEIDNCEVSAWSHAAIHLWDGGNHRIHHNTIHHNQFHGLGYGVCHGYGKTPTSLIEYNLFDYNRHSIAGTGKPGNAYEARHNIELGHANGHYFDMHGGGDRRDGTTIAGDWLKITNNTFMRAEHRVIAVRGVPRDKADIQRNWFCHQKPDKQLILPWPTGGETRVDLHDNAYGLDTPALLDITHATFDQAFPKAKAAHEAKRYRTAQEHAKVALELAKTGPERSQALALTARCCEARNELSGAQATYEQIRDTADAAEADRTAAEAALHKIKALIASRQVKNWKLVFSDDFEREKPGENWRALSGKWHISDGKLVCGEVSENVILLTTKVSGFQRVVFDAATNNKRPCDLSTLIHSNREGRDGGYFFQFGGSGNTFNSLRRAGVFTRYAGEQCFIERGKTHRITAEFDGAAARLTVDDRVVLEYIDPKPLHGKDHDQLGFYIYSSGTIDNVRVYQANPTE